MIKRFSSFNPAEFRKVAEKKAINKPSSVQNKKTSSVNISPKKVNESVIKSDENFKVKTVLDVKLDLVNQFIDKVKKETGQNPLEFWSAADLAEEMVRYVMNQFLKVDNIPTEIAIGDGNVTERELEEEREKETAAFEDETATSNTASSTEAENMEEEEQQPRRVKIQNENWGLSRKFTDFDLEEF